MSVRNRKPPGSEPPGLAECRDRTLFDLNLQVVTPMFGGSADAGQVDPERPINAKSVRGHLRYWWRACRGGNYQTSADMFAAEAAIWGGVGLKDKNTETGQEVGMPSNVIVTVAVDAAGERVACMEQCLDTRSGRPGNVFQEGWPPYALFPFQGQRGGASSAAQGPADALKGVAFHLTLSAAPHVKDARLQYLKDEVAAAVWAWVLFGGVGARTRRGCGSLYCANWPFSRLSPDALSAIVQDAKVMVAAPSAKSALPTLAGAHLCLGRERSDPIQTWSQAIELMKDFRQGKGYARNPGSAPKRPGRSRWPEPDSIRKITGKSAPGHEPSHPAAPYFPRADLGLPIVFHFKDEGDPDDVTLEAAGKERSRMASPIILKPLAVEPDSALVMALVLNAPHVWEPLAPGVKMGLHGRMAELNNPKKAEKVEPLRQQGCVGARDAFRKYAVTKMNLQEVTL